MLTESVQLPPIAEVKPLVLHNYNNVLDCDSFLYLQRPPDKLLLPTDLNVLYLVQHREQQLRLRLVELIRVPFRYVGDMITYAATGMDGVSWRCQWLERHPETKEETEIGVYIYSRVLKELNQT